MKVKEIIKEGIIFDNGWQLYSDHMSDCCEHHWLEFEYISIEDFEGLEFDLSNDNFFERIPDYGIALLPINGHPIRIPGYGDNNGYYGADITLVLQKDNETLRFDVSECQDYWIT